MRELLDVDSPKPTHKLHLSLGWSLNYAHMEQCLRLGREKN